MVWWLGNTHTPQYLHINSFTFITRIFKYCYIHFLYAKAKNVRIRVSLATSKHDENEVMKIVYFTQERFKKTNVFVCE